MIELVMTVCLMAQPEDCRKERLPFDGPLMACAVAGQMAAADWISTHPKWQVKRLSCGMAARDA